MGSTSAWNKKHYCLHVKVVEANLSFQLSSSLAGLRPYFSRAQRTSGTAAGPGDHGAEPRELAGGHAAC